MPPIPALPTFALVGQPNEGKTTVMATLAENDRAAISAVPGTTRVERAYPVEIDGRTIAIFHDTPGFEHAGAALKWFRARAEHSEPAAEFIAAFDGGREFAAEVEILRPLAAGAAAIYVADASRPVRAVDREEIEILRLAGVRRIGVLNSKDGAGEFRDEWRRLLARDFNHIHEFNGHHATFRDRLRLLEAARAVLPEWGEPMDRCVTALRAEWDARLREVAALLACELGTLAGLRERVTIEFAGGETAAAERAKSALMEAVRRRERALRGRLREIFRHSAERWDLGELLAGDLFSAEVWRFLGLARWQLAGVGALAGGFAGGLVDLHFGGASLGAVAAAGAAAGGAVAWFSAERAVNVTLPELRLGPLRFPRGKLGGRQAEASLAPQSNLPWILLDRAFLYLDLCTHWAHGRREPALTVVEDDTAKRGETARWTRDERAVVAKFLERARRGDAEKREAAERALQRLLVEKLRALSA